MEFQDDPRKPDKRKYQGDKAVIFDGEPITWERFQQYCRNIESVGVKVIRRVGRDDRGREVYRTIIDKKKYMDSLKEG